MPSWSSCWPVCSMTWACRSAAKGTKASACSWRTTFCTASSIFLSIEERTIVISETLHAIIAHRSGGKPLTIEAGIVRVADALDLSEGRSRIPYQAGKIDIHSISAAAIDRVEIAEGTQKPVQINIWMNNMAGIFQVDELLKQKLVGSGIEKYIIVSAYLNEAAGSKLIKEFEIS